MKIKYNLLHEEKNTKARLGTIETNYGVVKTPMFMPVGTRATVKMLTLYIYRYSSIIRCLLRLESKDRPYWYIFLP